jgi:hypothetical protein
MENRLVLQNRDRPALRLAAGAHLVADITFNEFDEALEFCAIARLTIRAAWSGVGVAR